MLKIEREQYFKSKGLDTWTCDICGEPQINSISQICLYGKLHCDKCAHKVMKPWKKERKNVIKEIKQIQTRSFRNLKYHSTIELQEILKNMKERK